MPLDVKQQDLPLGLNPQDCLEDIAAWSLHPGIPLPELGKLYAAELQPPAFQSLLSSHDKEPSGKQFTRSLCAATITPYGTSKCSQKRLLIFDQSGNQTRLLQCPFPLHLPSPEPMKLGLEKCFMEEFGENHLNGNESEMHEDTEEINALLYSDDNYESDDEVMSTDHSPYQFEEIDFPPCKRQKVLDKVENFWDSSSLVGSKSSIKPNGLSFVKEKKLTEDNDSGLSNKKLRKDKIRTAMKILESVVPGANRNEAIFLLDEAIDYLKLLKQDLISTEIKKFTDR